MITTFLAILGKAVLAKQLYLKTDLHVLCLKAKPIYVFCGTAIFINSTLKT